MLGVALLLLATILAVVAVNDRPVIGILSQPNDSHTQYIAASYVKYLEAAGARVVPIFYNNSVADITALVNSINGVLFPGGGSDLSDGTLIHRAGQTIFKRAIEINDQGGYFPLWGTCMGFQFLAILTANKQSVLEGGFDSYNLPIPLDFTHLASNSRLFKGSSPQIMNWLATKDITMNNHRYSVTPTTFATNPVLSSFYDVLSVNVDRNNRPFVSTFEAKKYPIYGVQWHPEKNAFEWNTQENLPHSEEAVLAAQYTANFFVNEARKSNTNFDKSNFASQLFFNYNPVHTGAQGSTFVQEYIWNV